MSIPDLDDGTLTPNQRQRFLDLALEPSPLDSGATISGPYRLKLWRHVDHAGVGSCLFVMLNPSTADWRANDPTVRRCMAFARAWGFRSLLVGNLFAWSATDPAALLREPAPVGATNDEMLGELARAADWIVVAWGAHRAADHHPAAPGRAQAVTELLRLYGPLKCLGRTKSGAPRHPLYLASATEPEPYAEHEP